ncbi:hypothetical protein K8089_10090 [Aequorivita sp. F47161]|uniref:PD-(D/E)XK nuclease superfamily protein n=1 Tax=Aequorivita vitellina TaxID=2874475 RepID=A0A9X1U3A7_9FLAO|nr:hypothetical protein [Aequorivita vitellina]MCG2419373.1 hypothetical protein [Aequorivita vitellina]
MNKIKKSKIKTSFRLYSKNKSDLQSSVFDLISGDRETKQTKGLAYVFSLYPDFLLKFLEIKSVQSQIEKTIEREYDSKEIYKIEVSAEKMTKSKKRADIVLKIHFKKKHSLAIIIEAKSIKSGNINNIGEQISFYMKNGEIEDLKNIPIIGLILTKYKHNISQVINLEWSFIINFILSFCKKKPEHKILKDYFNFITNIDNDMIFFEKEVLSIPAGRSFSKVEKHDIYDCPNNKNYSYKKPLYVTFRKTKSVMEFLYKIEEIIVLNPTDENEIIALNNSTLSTGIKNRILNYINEPSYNKQEGIEKRFYVLSKEKIELSQKPKPAGHIQKHTYFSLTDILTKKVLIPESQK